jgi:hypothetical protein
MSAIRACADSAPLRRTRGIRLPKHTTNHLPFQTSCFGESRKRDSFGKPRPFSFGALAVTPEVDRPRETGFARYCHARNPNKGIGRAIHMSISIIRCEWEDNIVGAAGEARSVRAAQAKFLVSGVHNIQWTFFWRTYWLITKFISRWPVIEILQTTYHSTPWR